MEEIKETNLSYLNEECLNNFGEEKGKDIFEKVESLYNELCSKADSLNSEKIKYHQTECIFPVMAYYKALLSVGYAKDEALSFVRKYSSKKANIRKTEFEKIKKVPFTYFMYRLFVKSVMKKNYPVEGWETEWVKIDKKEIHFNLKRCIYKQTCDKQGCPELCAVYCENDDIAFSGLMPKIRFERSGTIGKGSEFCDFHFIKNK